MKDLSAMASWNRRQNMNNIECCNCKHWEYVDTDLTTGVGCGRCTYSESPNYYEAETCGAEFCSCFEIK